MIDHPSAVLDFDRARTTRRRRKADPIGIEVRASGRSFSLHGLDRGSFLDPRGAGQAVRWLNHDAANEAIEHHIATPSIDW